jgi:hypothetical protein
MITEQTALDTPVDDFSRLQRRQRAREHNLGNAKVCLMLTLARFVGLIVKDVGLHFVTVDCSASSR